MNPEAFAENPGMNPQDCALPSSTGSLRRALPSGLSQQERAPNEGNPNKLLEVSGKGQEPRRPGTKARRSSPQNGVAERKKQRVRAGNRQGEYKANMLVLPGDALRPDSQATATAAETLNRAQMQNGREGAHKFRARSFPLYTESGILEALGASNAAPKVLQAMDIFPRQQRSRIMSRIRGRDTQPELLIRSMLHELGYRFRLHRKDLTGTPDIVFPSRRSVVFVNGCFWHGHRCPRGHLPSSNVGFWEKENRQEQAARSQCTETLTQGRLESFNGVGMSDQEQGAAVEEACPIPGAAETERARMNLSR